MSETDLYVWLLEKGFDADEIDDVIWDRMESFLEDLENETLEDAADDNCGEVLCKFKKYIPKSK